MNFLSLLTAALSIFAIAGIAPDVAHADPEICELLAEMRSVDSHNERFFHYRMSEEDCRYAYWSELRPLPLSKILNEVERAQYEEAIAKQDCEAAKVLLIMRFVEAYPDVPSIILSKRDYRVWESRTVGRHFPTLALCLNLEVIGKAQQEIDQLGLRAPPYMGYDKSPASYSRNGRPLSVFWRRTAVFKMQRNLRSSFSPDIALALLKLSMEGKALKYHPLNELYLAYKLRNKGLRDPIIQQVIERPLDSQLKADVERKAKLGEFEGIPEYPD